MFTSRHRLVAIPGIALCWGLVFSCFRPALRALFCAALVAATVVHLFRSPNPTHHLYTWKYAISAAEKNASPDNAPVLICSDLIESNYSAMPLESPKTSNFFAPLSYYRLTVPVVPLPRALNREAIQVASRFLQEAREKHERFLAMGSNGSYETLNWLTQQDSGAYKVKELGVFDRIKVLEFTPRD
jgi:hypothetical protein